jgi:hypothetical protein
MRKYGILRSASQKSEYMNFKYSDIYPELETPQPIIIATVVKVQWNGKSSTSSLDLTSFFFASLHIWP